MLFLLLLCSCSTTRKLGEGEVLYTGLDKITIEEPAGVKLTDGAHKAVDEPLAVKPNNALFSPYVRSPLPIGLWVYNNWQPKREKGFFYWIYQKLVKEPILISTVQPEVRAGVAADILQNQGYFGSTVRSEVVPDRRNPKKARVSYHLQVGEPYSYREIGFPTGQTPIVSQIDSLKANSLLRDGEQYNTDTLAAERQRIAEVLRNEGYYYFRPEYLEFLADTTQGNRQVEIQMIFKEGVNPAALKSYKTGDIALRLSALGDEGEWRSSAMSTYTLDYQEPLQVKPALLDRSMLLRTGEVYSLKNQTETQNRLNRLGLFRYVNLAVTPLDSLADSDTLDVSIQADFNYPLDAMVGLNVTSKSNSFIGPELNFTLNQNNVWGGAEVLSLNLNGSYEWQTGGTQQGSSSLLNSYELGINTTLVTPRLLMLGFVPNKHRYPQRTELQAGVDLMNRPSYFRMISFHLMANYSFQSSAVSYHTFTPLKLVYSRLLNTTDSFENAMQQNPAIALSFETSFTPSMNYTYRYEKSLNRNNRFAWEVSLTEAGNLMVGAADLVGIKGTKKLFDTPISQFVKGVTQTKYYHRLHGEQWLAMRFLVGAAHAYGNSTVVPYSEQFYIGGANSIRAFTIRSIGPGSYRPEASEVDGYLDQTGNFKLEANIEYRFPLAGNLHGALFVDAGNIWLLQYDAQRKGGELLSKTFLNDIALGTGCGLRYDMGYIVLRGDLGVAIHTPYPNPEKSGYYNLSNFGSSLAFHLAIGYPF